MSGRAIFSILVLVLIAFFASNTLYIVNEFERGVLLRLGKVDDNDIKAGLHAKIPFIDVVRKFDARVLTLDARPERFLTVEKKSMMVDSFAKWRIIDVGNYYVATNGEEARAERLLAQRINEGLRNQFAQRSLQEVVSGERDQLMVDLTNQLNEFTQDSLGIEVVDVRVKRIDLPEEVSGPVYSRMSAEREKEAREHRSKGKEQAEIIRADADRQRTILEAQAYRDAELLRGEGDAKAAAIYANAYNKDPDFYAFVRSLTAYKTTFKSKDDIMLIDPDSEFFRYLKDAQGKK
ncbi:protease modulator HflC [Teredinibacter sp. KSP-S5-2]|uniref:protease modulator HflC n=1 Tax=Teredinibacter sp. KSP-S5-2 TaxID=3034506 RepID=UPI002934B118|nr:protease modulator HflC [Teredinibacter sp. KSP-S5-2]WNO08170.1 protease modulator HflC [Teredinibacter sp. KSP-S5-2]